MSDQESFAKGACGKYSVHVKNNQQVGNVIAYKTPEGIKWDYTTFAPGMWRNNFEILSWTFIETL